MYQHKYRSGFRGKNRNFSRPQGRGFRARSFDPTHVVDKLNAQNSLKQEVHVVVNTFGDFDIEMNLKKNLAYKGFTTPTPIQDQAINPILQGRDLIGIANTGTGKTLAFLIPLINKVVKNRHEKVLIVAPTRELANQIREEFYWLGRGLGIYSALCIGGANMNRQKNELRRNPNFVIGTPGRLEDHIRNKSLNLSDFGSVVLDEADHMVDIGFIKNVKYIVSLLSKKRQSLFFSATIDVKVKEILSEFVNNPVTVSVKSGDTARNVYQKVMRVGIQNKFEELFKLLKMQEFEKVLIFGRTKHGVQRLSDDLRKSGLKSDAIHGNKGQNQRLRILESFKRDNLRILIATDVAARGLDISNVSHVINYDLPESYENYIHRIGRTGRSDKKGIAITFTN